MLIIEVILVNDMIEIIYDSGLGLFGDCVFLR